jgi:hypothetical protein
LVAIWDYQPLGPRHEGGFEFENEETHRSLFHGAAAATGLSEMVSAIYAQACFEPRRFTPGGVFSFWN